MSAIYIAFHAWRGLSFANGERDLFSYVFKLGFCTVYICRVCVLEAYRKLRATIECAVRQSEEGR